jgi:predicted nuclease with TOPRIM domain
MSALNWKYTPKTKDLPATQGILHLVRNELKENISELKAEIRGMNGRFDQIDGKFAQIDGKFDQIDGRFAQIDGKFVQVDGRFDQLEAKMDEMKHELKGEISRLAVLVEEQNVRNNIVLEGLSGLFHRQEKVENRIDNVEKNVGSLGFPRK